jgi:hypothetical protein
MVVSFLLVSGHAGSAADGWFLAGGEDQRVYGSCRSPPRPATSAGLLAALPGSQSREPPDAIRESPSRLGWKNRVQEVITTPPRHAGWSRHWPAEPRAESPAAAAGDCSAAVGARPSAGVDARLPVRVAHVRVRRPGHRSRSLRAASMPTSPPRERADNREYDTSDCHLSRLLFRRMLAGQIICRHDDRKGADQRSRPGRTRQPTTGGTSPSGRRRFRPGRSG